MLSTPVCGVELRKDMVAPRLAPIFRIEEATGMTEQEQRGRGMPSIAALKTEYILDAPSCRIMSLGGSA